MNQSIPIKTQEEFEIMRHGGIILKKTLDKMEKSIRPGMSTLELDRIAEEMIRSHKGAVPGFKGYNGFPATLCISINNEVVHGIPHSDRIFKDGDIAGVDCGVLYGGFYTDACRTFIIGEASSDLSHFVQSTKNALQNAVAVVRPGATIGDISAVIQESLESEGYSPVIECTGHGVGKNLHEAPEILNVGRRGTGDTLREGMAIAIEPIATMGRGEVATGPDGWTVVTADGSLSAHFEHTVIVTKDGHEILV